MITKREVDTEIAQLSTMRELVEAYEEIAATRMRVIRSSVLKTREFLDGLTAIFQEVKISYGREIIMLMKKKKLKDRSKLSLIKRNGKTVALLLSSNTGLYGDIMQRTCKSFNEYVTTKERCDVAIVGKMGRRLFTEQNPTMPFAYFDITDKKIDLDSLRRMVDYLVAYERILLFFGRYQSIVSQIPTMLDMYGNLSPETEFSGIFSVDTLERQDQTPQSQQVLEEEKKYLFEPSIETVLTFFESEIFMSIFEQTMQESNLAKYAARMFMLDVATENISQRLGKMKLQKRVMVHRRDNKKQLDAISGMRLWKR